MRQFIQRVATWLALSILVLGTTTAWAQRTFTRSQRGWQRDVRRLATAPKITDEKGFFAGKTSFTKSRVPQDQASWRSFAEGKKPFSICLNKGCTISGEVFKLRLPMVTTVKFTDLKLTQNGRTTSLMPKGKMPVLYDGSTAYWHDNKRITWNGPESRYAVLALFHELGHAKDYAGMTKGQRAEFKEIYDRKSNQQTLTKAQQRKMVAFERSAWSHALKQTRKLKKQGFDVLGNTPRREVMDTVYGALRGYYDYKGTRDEAPSERGWPGL